jgi:hypothetical protein
MTEIIQEIQMKEVTFPPSISAPGQPVLLKCQTSIVVIGANGSGKSRLGGWLELKGPQKAKIHRITAQRSLVFPESTSPISYKAAEEAFHWAPRPVNWDEQTYESNKSQLRLNARYGKSSNLETAPLNDFEKLLTLLFSDSYTKLLEHEAQQRRSDVLVPLPENLLRKVQTVWESVLPHRKLQFLSGEVRAVPTGSEEMGYPARAMSDGERVIFYLIAQCLCARDESIIVVDEPEIHLHKAIQDTLWNAIEKARPDCAFVYLTHDLMFAADRIGAVKVCLKDYLNGEFNWFRIESQDSIPEDIYLEVLGSRKPILFVEGSSNSYDLEIYQLTYPQFSIKPVGSCASVLAATKVFRSLRDLHRIECFGMIDRDYLSQEQLQAYASSGIFTPLVAEIENLYLAPGIIKAVANQLLLNPELVFESVKEFIIDEFQRNIHAHALDATRHIVNLKLGQFGSKDASIEDYSNALQNHIKQIDAEKIYNTALQEANRLVSERDYDGIIRAFNKKDLTKKITRFFNIKQEAYIDKVREMTKRDFGNIPLHFSEFLPKIKINP